MSRGRLSGLKRKEINSKYIALFPSDSTSVCMQSIHHLMCLEENKISTNINNLLPFPKEGEGKLGVETKGNETCMTQCKVCDAKADLMLWSRLFVIKFHVRPQLL